MKVEDRHGLQRCGVHERYNSILSIIALLARADRGRGRKISGKYRGESLLETASLVDNWQAKAFLCCVDGTTVIFYIYFYVLDFPFLAGGGGAERATCVLIRVLTYFCVRDAHRFTLRYVR